jgi:3-methyl-2-oxobutanoate hydroxymethyltransferase
VQGKSISAADALLKDALALEEAGAVTIVLEGVPREVAEHITKRLNVPTIGIGAGPDCDGQILVFHDLVNLSFSKPAKFVRQYGDAAGLFRAAIDGYVRDVEQRGFPNENESYHLPQETRAVFESTATARRKA